MALPAIALHGQDDSPAHGPALLDGGNFQQMGHDIAGCDLIAAVRGSVDQCMSRCVSAGDVVRDVGQDVFPWIGDAAFFLFSTRQRPHGFRDDEVFALGFIMGGFADELQSVLFEFSISIGRTSRMGAKRRLPVCEVRYSLSFVVPHSTLWRGCLTSTRP